MREGILRGVFVGSDLDSCKVWKNRIENISMDGVKKLEVHTAVTGEGVHGAIMDMDDGENEHMPHLVLIEERDMQEEFYVIGALREMLPMQKFVLLFSRSTKQRMLQSLIVRARQNGFDLFLAKEADDAEIVEMFELVAKDHRYSVKAIEPVSYLLEKTD